MGRPKKKTSGQPADGAAGEPGPEQQNLEQPDLDSAGAAGSSSDRSNDQESDNPAGSGKASSSKTSSKASSKRKTSRKSRGQSSEVQPRAAQPSEPSSLSAAATPSAVDPSWHTTEELLKTLNQELGGLKEYVLADLRGEITSLRSRKLQIETEIKRLESDRDRLLSDREQAQQQQWAQQFSQVMAQNLRQELQAQLLGSDNPEKARPEQRLLLLREQIADMESALTGAINGIRQELGRHESDLSQQVLRMQSLEQQGETILENLLQRLQTSSNIEAADIPRDIQEPALQEPNAQARSLSSPTPSRSEDSNDGDEGLSPISFTLGSTSTTGIAASLRARTDVPTNDKTQDSVEETTIIPAESAPTGTRAASMGDGTTSTTLNEFPADVLFGRAAQTPPPEAPAKPKPPIPPFDSDWVQPPPEADASLADTDSGTDNEIRLDPPPFGANAVEAGFYEPATPEDQVFEAAGSDPMLEQTPWDADDADAAAPIQPQAETLDSEAIDQGQASFEAFEATDFEETNFEGTNFEEAEPSGELVPDSSEDSALDAIPRAPITVPAADRASQIPGFISAGLSLLLLALQYCTVQLIFHGAPWLGVAEFMQPSWASALLTFWIRMLMVLPFMIVIGQGIYPPLLEEMQELFRSRDRRPLISIVLSSLLLFLSQLLLYRAIGISSASVAVGLLFVYPAAVSIFGVGLFQRRISQQTLLTLLPIGLGGMILLFQSGSNGVNPGIVSAICFALYALVGRLYTRRLNVLTLTVMQFGIAWLFSMPALLFLRNANPSNDVGYVVACLVLSLTVFLSYFFNTASLNRLGPAWTSIINGWAPLLVAVISILFGLGSLTFPQGLGVLLVTLGVTALNLERLRR